MRAFLIAAAAAVAAATEVDWTVPALDLDLIDRVNSDAQATWTAGVNSKFVGMTLGQAKTLMGSKGLTPEGRVKFAALPKSDIVVPEALPTSFNSTANWPKCASVIGHIRDQSDCGCCWAFGSTEAFNDRLCIVHNITVLLSPQDTCSCCDANQGCSGSGGCDGGFTEDAFNYFKTYGVVTGGDNPSKGSGSSCFPYQLEMCDHHEGGPYPTCPNVCSGGECATPACPLEAGTGCSESGYATSWAKDKHFGKGGYGVQGVDKIMTEIMTNGPVSASFTVYSDFLTYKSGVYVNQGGTVMGGHAVKIIGWGTEGGQDYWLVANSWNNYWGDFGFFKILRGADECGIEDDIVTGSV